MFKDDDDDHGNYEATVGTKYEQVMPSLIALQQMRNRLHLAYLGKKLMSWTAIATNKEMRRIAEEIALLYQDYKTEVAISFMYLARGRFFYENLNKMVLENLPSKARCTVNIANKSVAGVKLRLIIPKDSGKDPYPHLGIEKGGQAILDAKNQWFSLLNKMIIAVQLRAMFLQVEEANRAANKKEYILKNIVIPKSKATIAFIRAELDEMERDDIHRLKMIKRKKVMKEKQEESKLKLTEEQPEDKQTVKEPMIKQVVPKVSWQFEFDPVNDICCKPLQEEHMIVGNISKNQFVIPSWGDKTNSVKQDRLCKTCKEIKQRSERNKSYKFPLNIQEKYKPKDKCHHETHSQQIKEELNELIGVLRYIAKKKVRGAKFEDLLQTAKDIKARMASDIEVDDFSKICAKSSKRKLKSYVPFNASRHTLYRSKKDTMMVLVDDTFRKENNPVNLINSVKINSGVFGRYLATDRTILTPSSSVESNFFDDITEYGNNSCIINEFNSNEGLISSINLMEITGYSFEIIDLILHELFSITKDASKLNN